MPPLPTPRKALLPAALALVPSLALAQGSVDVGTLEATNTRVTAACHANAGTSASITTCPGSLWNGTFSGTASAVAGVVRSASVITPPSSVPERLSLQVTSQARWQDVARLSGSGAGTASLLELTFRLTGSIASSVSPTTGSSGYFNSANSNAHLNFDGLQIGQWQTGVTSLNCSTTAPPCAQSIMIDQTYTEDVMVSGGLAAFNVDLFAQAAAGLDGGLPGASADLGHTLVFTGYRVLAAGGMDLTPTTTVTFDNGTSFAALSTTAPEPGTWALLGTGLLGVGAAVRRRGVT